MEILLTLYEDTADLTCVNVYTPLFEKVHIF
jgi:hypothetical protein